MIYDCKKKVELFLSNVYHLIVASTVPIPIRLGEDIIARLDEAAKRLGNNRASLVRFLIDSWLADYESRGNAFLPPNWEAIMAGYDHRTKEARNKISASPEKNAPNRVRTVKYPHDKPLTEAQRIAKHAGEKYDHEQKGN
jgi:metal-responsive CopG/Arc/MetJ family transcriptional regulator